MNKKVALLALALLLAGVVSLWASAFPDGLEFVAEELGFIERAAPSQVHVFADYMLPFIGNETLAASLAGVFGVVLCVGLIWLIGKVFIKVQDQKVIKSSAD